MSIFDCLEMIRSAGFRMVEVCSSPMHLDYHDIEAVRRASQRMNELGMEPYSFHAPFVDVDISSLDSRVREVSQREILVAAEAAAVFGVRHFVIHPGPDVSLTFSVEEKYQRLKNASAVLDNVARRCQQLGVGLVLENMLPHLPFGSPSDMMWILGEMENLNICICLDTGHAALSGDIYNIMYKLTGHLRIIHANDNGGAGDDHLPPGKGVIDWKKVLYELGETEFHGGMILELSGADTDPYETLEKARQASLYIRKICKEMYLSRPPSVEVPNVNE
ncbi:Xylose isomerase [Chitinispirillum alkaliphilum]|nr:Xylose isomerase [Chitinispirillum alkaliphilum]